MDTATSTVVWERQVTTPLVGSTNFCDVERLNKYPNCLSPLHVIWKITGFTCMQQEDSTIAWTIWAWIYRTITVLISITVFFVHIFPGSNSILYWATESDVLIVQVALIATTICHGLISLYPLHFACNYIQNGHLHALLQNLVATKYVDPDYLNNDLFHGIQRRAIRWRWFTFLVVIIQFVGWMIQNEVSNPNTAYWNFASIFWPFCWAIFKFLPFVSGLSVFMIVLEVLRMEKDLYIQQLAAAGNSSRCKENKLYFVFQDIKFGHIKFNEDKEEMEKHLNDSYLNLVGLCNIHGHLWRWYVVLLCLSLIISVFCGASMLYFCGNTESGAVILIPSFYAVLALVLLYEVAELNETSNETLMLLSAVRLGKCSTQNQMIKMMEYNRVQITCAGIVIDYQRVNALAVTGATLLATATLKYIFPKVFDSDY